MDAKVALSDPALRVAAAIIAGGNARRLGGVAKGLLTVGGRRIIDRQIAALSAVFPRLFIVGNEPMIWAGSGLTIVADRVPRGGGPLAGIDAALSALTEDEDAVVCVAGDMPFLQAPALELLRGTDPAADAVAPVLGGRPEPLFARYGRPCGPAITRALALGRFKATEIFASVRTHLIDEAALRAVDPDLRSLVNINTREDLEREAGSGS